MELKAVQAQRHWPTASLPLPITHYTKVNLPRFKSPVCKDESSYLPQSAAVQPDLQADISSQTTKTKTLFTTENCRVTMRKPAGYGPQAQVSPHEPAKLQLW